MAAEMIQVQAVRAAVPGVRLPGRLGLAAGVRGRVPVPGNARPTGRHRRNQGRPRTPATDGPAFVRRRRLRQDRSCDSGRVQGDRQRQASRRARADDRARRAALSHVQPAVRRVPVQRRRGQPVQGRGQTEGNAQTPPRRRGRRHHRHPPAAVQGREVQGPRPGHHRRGTAVRRRAQGAAQEAPGDRPRPDHDRHADPADAARGTPGHPRNLQPGDAAARAPAGRDADHPLGRRPDSPRDPPRDDPRRAGLLRPQPRLRHQGRVGARSRRSCPRPRSSSATGR